MSSSSEDWHAILVLLAAAQLGGRVSPVLGIRDPLEKVGRGEGTSHFLLVELCIT